MNRIAMVVIATCLAVGCSEPELQREKAPPAALASQQLQIPKNATFGQPSAVDIDSHGHVFVLHRAGRVWEEPFPEQPISDPAVFMFDGETGELLARWGAGEFIMPHGLSVDAQDDVWITDVAREQVFRFSHDGEKELVLGEHGVSGSDEGHFGRPSDIAFEGDRVLVSDGYVNTRVAIFDRDGEYLGQWGKAGEGEGAFNLPHAIAAGGGEFFVADRENARVQVFDRFGRFQRQLGSDATGHPYSVKPIKDGRVLVIEGRDRLDRTGAMLRVYSGDGTLLQTLDAGLEGEDASLGHDIAIGRDGSIWMVDVYGDRVVRLGGKPAKAE